MRTRTSVITAVVALAFAVPAAAWSATPTHHYAPVVITSVNPGTSAVSGGCTVTMVSGHVSSFRCPGSTFKANSARCTLTVATGRFWTYSCPGGVSGVSKGEIPGSCKTTLVTGFVWTFSCPKSAFGGSTATPVGAGKQGGVQAITPRRCTAPLADGYLEGFGCIL